MDIDWKLKVWRKSTMRKGDITELTIDRVAHGGRGVARVEGFVVFVKGAVPGDTARVMITKKKKDFAEARVVELIRESTDRIKAPCPYFGHCGGCQWQQVAYPRQLEYKKALVEEAVARIGGLSEIKIRDPLGSEKIFGYRNKMEFSFSDRPWLIDYHPPLIAPPPLDPLPRGEGKAERLCGRIQHNHPPLVGGVGGGGKPPERQLALGLHVPGTFNKVIDVEACLLQEERGNEILRAVKAFAKDSGFPPYNLKTHEGFWRFLTLRHSTYFREWMVNVITSEYKKTLAENLARFLASQFPDVKTVVNNVTSRHAGVAVGEWESVLTGTGVIEDRIGPYAFQISANSFFQTNTQGAATLYDIVVEYAELTGSENVLDLYSGTGTIPIFLASRSRQVVGMEIAESAVQDAGKNCRANGIENCRFILGDIRHGLSFIPFKPDVLIIDPPRAGMHKDVTARILELGTERIVYVSCNPATMARDLGEMKDSYEVAEIQPVDMFPHTYHVESVAKLVRKNIC
jgi:23S rRNA (uracil1939-C5)-methyltransferase